ncbi:YgjV family protein [Catenovulum sp. 2E275]|uniref:YgjV family protein n=1 Tax=Catenovulum sp. 2E275 TaxID=2980497 RepID=UPI0021CFD332|nr:YgjV family protein [Catenovulum sp. 2E275]MCU4676730.1 YgjV family protein [Catenovulum sp. 2E275]
MTTLMIAQAVGLFSVVLALTSFFQKNDLRLKSVMLLFNLNHALHFFLLGASTSAICCLFSAARTATSIKIQSKWVAFGFMSVTAVMGYLMATQWTDLIAILGACCGTYALFCLTGVKMRLCLLAGSCLWLTNNIIVGSIGGVMLESAVIVMNLTTIYRLYRETGSIKLALA